MKYELTINRDSIWGKARFQYSYAPQVNGKVWETIAGIVCPFTGRRGRLMWRQHPVERNRVIVAANLGGEFHDLATAYYGKAYDYSILSDGGVWSFGFDDYICGFAEPTPLLCISFTSKEICAR